MTSSREPLPAGTRLGPYELKGLLGVGGMGSVYRALDTRLGREVAVKVLPDSLAADENLLRRFEQESRLLAALNHPNVLGVFDVGQSGGRHFLVTELLQGETLDHHLSRPQRSLAHALDIALQLAGGLAAIHERGVIHRDLKPSNIFLTRGGQLKLIDFGLARTESGDELTKSGSFMGTPGYMGPEQLKGATLDPRADQFAFGAVLYELLTGQPAFDGAVPMERALAAMSMDPPDLAALCEGPQSELFKLVRRCVEKDPAARFGSMQEVLQVLVPLRAALGPTSSSELGHSLRGGAATPPLSSGPHDTVISQNRANRGAGRRWLMWAVGLVLVAGGGVGVWLQRAAKPPSATAVHRGGVLRFAAVESISNFDLFTSTLTLNRWAMMMMLEPLARLSAQGPIEPVVLEGWTISDDRKTVALTLRPNLRFHDHPCFSGGRGRLADGKDLVFSLGQALKGGQLELPAKPSELEATAQGAVLHLERPDAFVDTKLAGVFLIPRELEGCENLRNLKHPVGTGPFFLAEPPDTQSIHLARFAGYWRAGADGQPLPYLDGVVLRQVMDPQSALAQMAGGEVDLMYMGADSMSLVLQPGLPLRLQQQFEASGLQLAGLTTEGHPALLALVLANPKVGALGTPALRRAAWLALQRSALENVDPTLAPTARFYVPFSLGRNPAIADDPYDLKEARRLVAAAGPLPPLRLAVVKEHLRFGEPLKEQLERAGFKVQLQLLDRAGTELAMANRTTDAAVMFWLTSMRGSEPYPHVRVFRGVEHTYGFDSARLDALIAALATELEVKARAGLYEKIEAQLLEDLPMIPLGFVKPEASSVIAITSGRLKGHIDPLSKRLSQPGFAPQPASLWLEPAPP